MIDFPELKKHVSNERSKIVSFLEAMIKWARIESDYQSAMGKLAGGLEGSGFDELVGTMKDRADAAEGFSQWLKEKVVTRCQRELNASCKIDWTPASKEWEAIKNAEKTSQRAKIDMQRANRRLEELYRQFKDGRISVKSVEFRQAVDSTQHELADLKQAQSQCGRSLQHLYAQFMERSVEDILQKEISRLNIMRQTMFEIISLIEERSAWENASLEIWKLALFNFDPDTKIRALVDQQQHKNMHFTAKETFEFIDHDESSMCGLASVVAITRSRRFSEEEAMVPMSPEGFEGACTWDHDTEDEPMGPI
jgi:hypothetical protein